MIIVNAWKEIVSYCECPTCEVLIDFGSGCSFSGLEEYECDCGEKFMINPPKDDL